MMEQQTPKISKILANKRNEFYEQLESAGLMNVYLLRMNKNQIKTLLEILNNGQSCLNEKNLRKSFGQYLKNDFGHSTIGTVSTLLSRISDNDLMHGFSFFNRNFRPISARVAKRYENRAKAYETTIEPKLALLNVRAQNILNYFNAIQEQRKKTRSEVAEHVFNLATIQLEILAKLKNPLINGIKSFVKIAENERSIVYGDPVTVFQKYIEHVKEHKTFKCNAKKLVTDGLMLNFELSIYRSNVENPELKRSNQDTKYNAQLHNRDFVTKNNYVEGRFIETVEQLRFEIDDVEAVYMQGVYFSSDEKANDVYFSKTIYLETIIDEVTEFLLDNQKDLEHNAFVNVEPSEFGAIEDADVSYEDLDEASTNYYSIIKFHY